MGLVSTFKSELLGFILLQRYAEKDGNMTFSATPLGEALVAGYRAMGLANLWTPDLRGKIEANIAAVAAGQRTKVLSSNCHSAILAVRVNRNGWGLWTPRGGRAACDACVHNSPEIDVGHEAAVCAQR